MRRSCALLICLVVDIGPVQAAPGCLQETTTAGRAACLSAEADAAILAMETRTARLAALPDAAAPGIAPIIAGLTAGQRRWRAAMEADCDGLSADSRARAWLARAACRLAAVRARADRLHRIATMLSPHADRHRPRPEIEILVPFPGGSPGFPRRR